MTTPKPADLGVRPGIEVEEEVTTKVGDETEALAGDMFDNMDTEFGDESDGVESGGKEAARSSAPGGPDSSVATEVQGEATQPAGTVETVTAATETRTETQAPAPAGQNGQPAAGSVEGTQQAPAQPTQGQQVQASNVDTVTQGAAVGSTEFVEQIRQKLDEGRDTYLDLLSSKVYGMTEDEASAVLTEPEKVLPKLAARVHLEVVQNVLGTFAQVMPGLVSGVLEARTQGSAAIDKFFTEYPTLDRNTDYGTVFEIAKLVRQANPKMDSIEFGKTVAAMAMVKLGKVPTAAPPAPVAQPQAPFRPASGTTPLNPPNANTKSVWEEFVEQVD